MRLYEQAKRWVERCLEREQAGMSRWNRLLLDQLRLYVYVAREILSGAYITRAGALVFATILAIVPLGTVSFALFRAFGGLGTGQFDQIVEENITRHLLGPLAAARSETKAAPQATAERATPTPAPSEAAPGRAPTPEERRRVMADLAGKVSGTIRELISHASGARMSAFSVFMLIVSAVLLFDTIESAFNRIWHVERERSFAVKFPAFFTTVILGPLLVGLSIYFTREFNPVAHVSLPHFTLRVLARLSSVITTGLAFLIGYRLLPNTHVRWRPAMLGALVAAVGWEVAKWGFGLYLQNTIYTALYGSLAAFPIFLLWMYVTWIIVLFGAGIAYTSQNLTVLTETERRGRRVAPVSDRLALAVMAVVGRRFMAGEGSTALEHLIEALDASGNEIQRTSTELADAGLLEALTTGENALHYVPRRPLDSISVSDVMAATRRANSVMCRLHDPDDRRALDETFARLDLGSDQAAGGMSLADLARRMSRPPEEKPGA
jgi:membrane protein